MDLFIEYVNLEKKMEVEWRDGYVVKVKRLRMKGRINLMIIVLG
jgi:hypothetical protein